jgi:hypothetical protein
MAPAGAIIRIQMLSLLDLPAITSLNIPGSPATAVLIAD